MAALKAHLNTLSASCLLSIGDPLEITLDLGNCSVNEVNVLLVERNIITFALRPIAPDAAEVEEGHAGAWESVANRLRQMVRPENYIYKYIYISYTRPCELMNAR